MRPILAAVPLAFAVAVAVAACAPAGPPSAPSPATTGAPVVIGTFSGVIDPGAGTMRFLGPDGLPAPIGLVTIPENGTDGVTLSTDNLTTGINCSSGWSSFEGDVTITNHGAPLTNVYAEILTTTGVGCESCNSDMDTIDGATSAQGGLWAYGDIAGSGGAATRHWMMNNPNTTHYTFTGRVVTSAVYTTGAGNGWVAQITGVALASGTPPATLTVSVRLSPVDAGNNLYVLVDDTALVHGTPTLDSSLTGWAMSLSNSVAASVDFAFSGWRGDHFSTQAARSHYYPGAWASQTITTTSDDTTGTYTFAIPYSAIGAAAGAHAVAGHAVRVYVLYGGDLGIHSAAPVQSAAQVSQMSAATAPGLTDLDRAPPTYVLQ
jgi:hypothetical protein